VYHESTAIARLWSSANRDEAARLEEPPLDDQPSHSSQPLVIDEAGAPIDGWDDPIRGRIRWRTLFSKGGTPTDGITCGVAELEPGDWLGLHSHAPPEIYYVFAGSGVVTLDGREVAVRAGSAVFIPGMAEHGIRQTGTERLRFFYGFPVDSFDDVEYLFSAALAGRGR
jgi:mannose-6-phosphate isomerase-like protein (cupin superfamily)